MLARLAPFASGLRLCSRLVDGGAPRPALRLAAVINMAELHKAVVKSLPGEPNLTITLSLSGRPRNLDRPKDEALEKPLLRIQKSAAPQPDKRQRRQKAAAGVHRAQQLSTVAGDPPGEPAVPAVALHEGPTQDTPPLDAASTSNAEAWQHGRLLRVGEQCYRVEVNPPLIDRLELPGVLPFAGVPLYPLLAAHFAEEDACEWRWLRRAAAGDAWQEIEGASERRYVPAAEDVGCELQVECRPARRRSDPAGGDEAWLVFGEPASASTGPVRPAPGPLGAAPRLEQTQERARPPEFRVVSYNILADQYAATETAKTLLFKHCPEECLAPEYRRPLVLAELLGFQGDVVCLQEVDDKMFTQLLQPQLGAEGYQGLYTNKAGKVREGGATFWRTDRFELVAQRELSLKDFFPPTPGAPSHYGHVFGPMLQSSSHLLHALQRVATVAQLVLLRPVQPPPAPGGEAPPARPLLVANTHLFFHYMASHIRTMHTWVIMQEAHRFMQDAAADPALAPQLGGEEPTLLFCGDLNSDLNDGIPGAVELLNRGTLPADHWDWMWGVDFRWGMSARGEGGEGEEGGQEEGDQGEEPLSSGEFGEVSKMVHTTVEHAQPASPVWSDAGEGEVVPGVELSIPFRLASADQLHTPFTNYVKGYQGLLDYVWYSPGEVEVAREVSPPTTPRGLGGSYLPSPAFPSDHLPLVFDLRFRGDEEAQQAQQGQQQAARQRVGQQQGGQGGLRLPAAAQRAPGGGSGSGSGEAGGGGAGPEGDNVLPALFYNVSAAVAALGAGRVIALPTDTLYGVASCANSHEGVRGIYDVKERQMTKPLAICVADPPDVARYGHTEHLPKGLIEDLLPGPVTLLLTRRAEAPLAEELNPGVEAIGIRIPNAPFIRAICRQHRGALALTSANLSQGLSPTHVEEFQELWPRCAAVFDGGALERGRAGSTVIDLTQPGCFSIVRRGAGFSDAVRLLTGKHGLRHDVLPTE